MYDQPMPFGEREFNRKEIILSHQVTLAVEREVCLVYSVFHLTLGVTRCGPISSVFVPNFGKEKQCVFVPNFGKEKQCVFVPNFGKEKQCVLVLNYSKE